MAIASTDIVYYGSASRPTDDASTTGGAIDLTHRPVFTTPASANTLQDTTKVVSSDSGDTSQTVTVYGRLASGIATSDAIALNGTTTVNGVVTFEIIDRIVISASHTGTVSVKVFTSSTVIGALESGVLSMARMFLGAASDVSGGSTIVRYEKIFVKNNHATLALLAATLSEQADPSTIFEFATANAVNDTSTITNRITAPGSGILGTDGFSSSAKAIPGTDLAAAAKCGIWVKMTLTAALAPARTTYTPRLAGSSI